MSLGLIVRLPFSWGAIIPLQDTGLRKLLDSIGIRVVAILGLDFLPVLIFVLALGIVLDRPRLLCAARRGCVNVTIIITPPQNQFDDLRSRRLQSAVVVLHQALFYLKSSGNVPSQALLVGFMDMRRDSADIVMFHQL
jgi:hypothetical protein